MFALYSRPLRLYPPPEFQHPMLLCPRIRSVVGFPRMLTALQSGPQGLNVSVDFASHQTYASQLNLGAPASSIIVVSTAPPVTVVQSSTACPPHLSLFPTIMPSGYHNREDVLAANIRRLLTSLRPLTYDKVASKTEYWIQYVITERFTTPKDLAERVSSVAWDFEDDNSDIPRFLKEFRDAPHRSEQMRSFVDELCLHTLRWFAVASADSFGTFAPAVAIGGGKGFVRAASFVGHLIECGLLGRDLVRRHLKPLTTHCCDNRQGDSVDQPLCIKASAIHQLFAIAGETLLQGILEPEDVQDCFEMLERRAAFGAVDGIDLPDAVKLNVRFNCVSMPTCWPNLLHRNFARSILSGWRAERKKKKKGIRQPPRSLWERPIPPLPPPPRISLPLTLVLTAMLLLRRPPYLLHLHPLPRRAYPPPQM